MFLNSRLTFLFCFIFAFSIAQNEKENRTSENELDEVIVTATRTLRQLSLAPMPVILISKKQIESTGAVRLRNLLQEQTGITFVKDVGNSEGIQMQGIAADYILVMIDGVPLVGRTAGNLDLNRVTVNNIKQVEVVKGSSSCLYGSEALGGVVNIITEKPKKDQLKGDFHLMTRLIGDQKELDINGGVRYKKGSFSNVTDVNLNSSGGYDLVPETTQKTVNPYQNYTFNSRFLYDLTDKVTFDLSGRFYQQNIFVNSVTDTQTDWNINSIVSHKISDKWDIDYTFYATRNKTATSINNTTYFNRSLIRPEIRAKLDFDNGVGGNFLVGIGGNQDRLDRFSINGEKYITTWYGFTQYDFEPLYNVNLVAGFRYDGSNNYQNAYSPKLSLSWKLNNKITIKGSGGYGFKIPDFRQLFFDFRNVNNGYVVLGTHTIHNLFAGTDEDISGVTKQLKPEIGLGFNVGTSFKPIKNLKINVNLFRNDIRNLIDSFDTELDPVKISIDGRTRIFSYKNFEKVFTQGVEFDLNYKFNDNFRFLMGYQFLDTGDKAQIKKLKKGIVFKDENGLTQRASSSIYYGLPNRSKHMVNAKVFYENFEHDFSLNIRGTYRSKFVPRDTNGNDVIDKFDRFVKPITQVNLAIDKTFFGNINFLVGVDNVLNSKGLKNGEQFYNIDETSKQRTPDENFLLLGRTIYGRLQFKI